jgi:hypothetical protein
VVDSHLAVSCRGEFRSLRRGATKISQGGSPRQVTAFTDAPNIT